jgi:hypothetical protein
MSDEIDLSYLQSLEEQFDGEEFDGLPASVIVGWCMQEAKPGQVTIPKPQSVPRPPKPECEKKHITNSGKQTR